MIQCRGGSNDGYGDGVACLDVVALTRVYGGERRKLLLSDLEDDTLL